MTSSAHSSSEKSQDIDFEDVRFNQVHDCHETDTHQEFTAAERSNDLSVIEMSEKNLWETLWVIDHFLQQWYEETHWWNEQIEHTDDLTIVSETEDEHWNSDKNEYI